MSLPQNIAILAYDGANAVDIFGPLQVFNSANPIIKGFKPEIDEAYNTSILGIDQESIRLATKTKVICDALLTDRPSDLSLDTLLIAGGEPAANIANLPNLTTQLLPIMNSTRRVASVCSGAFILAATGELAQRKATTHWDRYDEFKANHPDVRLDIDALFTQDGKYYCSAGVTAGIDLALNLVEQDYGRRIALETAREMVVFYHRPGGQNQYGASQESQRAQHSGLLQAQQFVDENLDKTLSVSQLADLAAMSVRHFSRRFNHEAGVSPSRYIALSRLNKARLLLEETNSPINQIASRCGYQSDEIMRRLFTRELNVSPSEYRKRFHIIP